MNNIPHYCIVCTDLCIRFKRYCIKNRMCFRLKPTKNMDTAKKSIEAFLNLGMELGFDNVTLQNVADRVGIKKPSLLFHFKNFDELKNSAVSYASSFLNSTTFDLNTKAKTKEELLVDFINNCIDTFLQFPICALLLYTEQKKLISNQALMFSQKFDSMICSRLTVTLDYCVQRSWADIDDTNQVAALFTPFIRDIIVLNAVNTEDNTQPITDDTLSQYVRTLVKLL